MQKITGSIGNVTGATAMPTGTGPFAVTVSGDAAQDGNGAIGGNISFDTSRVARTSVETRGMNAAFYPRIHI
jgi:hypothetical protein